MVSETDVSTRKRSKSMTTSKSSKLDLILSPRHAVPVAAVGAAASCSMARSSSGSGSQLRNTLIVIGIIMILAGYGYAGYIMYKRLQSMEKDLCKTRRQLEVEELEDVEEVDDEFDNEVENNETESGVVNENIKEEVFDLRAYDQDQVQIQQGETNESANYSGYQYDTVADTEVEAEAKKEIETEQEQEQHEEVQVQEESKSVPISVRFNSLGTDLSESGNSIFSVNIDAPTVTKDIVKPPGKRGRPRKQVVMDADLSSFGQSSADTAVDITE
jgi:hypothetical protein